MNFNNNHLLNQTHAQNYNNINNMNVFNKFNQNTNQAQAAQMSHMYHTMQNLKKMQQSKLLAKINELEKNKSRLNVDKNELRNLIIRPIKIEKSDKHEITIKYKDLENNFSKRELENLWVKRNNQPYKNIIKDERYIKPEYKKREDLIVHKVTSLDKIGVDTEFDQYNTNLEKHNGELKIQYSQSKELENKKKFEYNNLYKYATKYDPQGHGELKENNIDYLKKEQEKIVKDKKNIDDIIQNLVVSNILTEEEKRELLYEGGEENNISQEPKPEPEISSTEQKPFKITIKSKKIDSSNINNDTIIDAKIEENLRDKYLNRKKK